MSTTKRDSEGRIVGRVFDDPEAKVYIEGYGYFAEYEAEEARRQCEEKRAERDKAAKECWLATDEGKLCAEIYNKFQLYKKYMEKNPYKFGRGDGKPMDFPEHMLFAAALKEFEEERAKEAETRRQRLEKAQLAARCTHVHMDGERCGSPKMKDKDLCFMHERMKKIKAAKLDLGPMEDADSIQVAIKKLQVAVIDGTLDNKQVSQLAYLIQLAAWNVRSTTFGMRYESGQ
ncbi:MAG TPA: hypothetical protein VLT16_19635 [Candidatus Limnocylindrales bacterium]|nr:hypothetical protein [Candidatus Limnocylindrales bacterium]